MNELQEIEKLLPEDNLMIVVEQGSVTCYIEQYKERIYAINNYLKHLTVSEETLREAEKLMARVNKAVKQLSDTRIKAKRTYLEPFTTLENEIKELEREVKEANNTVREQTKKFHEMEREDKFNTLCDIWNKRVERLVCKDFFEPKDFITNQHLNKSVTIKKVESEMATFIDRIEKDIVKLIPYCRENQYPVQEGLTIYKKNYNYGDFLDEMQDKFKVEEELEEIIDTPEEVEIYEEPKFVFFKVPYAVAGVVRNYFEQNSIQYEELID